MPSVETHDDRAIGDKFVESAHSSALVRQFEAGHGLADLRGAVSEIPAFEPVDEALPGREKGRHPLPLLLEEELDSARKRRV